MALNCCGSKKSEQIPVRYTTLTSLYEATLTAKTSAKHQKTADSRVQAVLANRDESSCRDREEKQLNSETSIEPVC